MTTTRATQARWSRGYSEGPGHHLTSTTWFETKREAIADARDAFANPDVTKVWVRDFTAPDYPIVFEETREENRRHNELVNVTSFIKHGVRTTLSSHILSHPDNLTEFKVVIDGITYGVAVERITK